MWAGIDWGVCAGIEEAWITWVVAMTWLGGGME
jgi:hypothetical protein